MSDQLDRLRAAWEAVARYRVVRNERGRRDIVLGTGLTWSAARALEEAENSRIQAAPGYRPVMSRALALVELENPEEARAACRAP